MSNRIKDKRIQAGLSQNQLAEKSGVSVRTLQDWEAGRRVPRDVYIIHKLAIALECAIEDLIESGGN